jgi:hypothetical protein
MFEDAKEEARQDVSKRKSWLPQKLERVSTEICYICWHDKSEKLSGVDMLCNLTSNKPNYEAYE